MYIQSTLVNTNTVQSDKKYDLRVPFSAFSILNTLVNSNTDNTNRCVPTSTLNMVRSMYVDRY